MKEVIVHPLPELTTEIHEVPIPNPRPDEVVIRVAVAGSNVKDWLHITALNVSINSGDDIAGTVHSLGADVEATGEFHIGDRVAAFHPMGTPGGAYAEFAVAPAHTVFIVPKRTSFEGTPFPPPPSKSKETPTDPSNPTTEAATIPLVTLTAALSLFRRQSLPPPWSPRSQFSPPLPLIIYGASSALGSFAVKLGRAANIHPIIAICGGSRAYITGLLDPSLGDAVIDYRDGVDAMILAVRTALGPLKARHALDAISSKGTWIPLTQMVDPNGGQVSVVSGANRYDEAEIPAGVLIKYTYVGTTYLGAYKAGMPKQPADAAAKGDVEFAYLLLRYVGRMLGRGKFEGHPVEVIPGGLEGVQEGLRRLKRGDARGVKFVYRVQETEGVVGGE